MPPESNGPLAVLKVFFFSLTGTFLFIFFFTSVWVLDTRDKIHT